MDTMRMESGFLHWGHDISPEENQYEAGLNFAISYKKEVPILLVKKVYQKLKKKNKIEDLLCCHLIDSKPGCTIITE